MRDWKRALVAPAPATAEQEEQTVTDARSHTSDAAGRAMETVAQGGDTGMITAEQAFNEMTEARIQRRFESLAPFLDEKQRRLLVAAEAVTYGDGGIERVASLVSVAPSTVRSGLRELQDPESIEPDRVRCPGGGRKRAAQTDPTLLADLEALVAPETRGDPQSSLRWTGKSTRKLAQELNEKGHTVSHTVVAELLRQLGYSLQSTRKTREGADHPDRDAQFRHISATVQDFQQRDQPVISVDTKKKELVGDFKNASTEWQPKGQPQEVRVHDFMDPELGKVSPYGIYDLTRNKGWVNVGTDHDTAAFAAASIRGWWQNMDQCANPDASELLITADGGGSNNLRSHLCRLELQKLTDDTGLRITVCHFPPGTSKWNNIEHRMFSHITQNWRGRPLSSHEVIVNLIANTTTSAGLTVQCQLDKNTYPTGVKVPDADLSEVDIERSDSHGEWNYTIRPHVQNNLFIYGP